MIILSELQLLTVGRGVDTMVTEIIVMELKIVYGKFEYYTEKKKELEISTFEDKKAKN